MSQTANIAVTGLREEIKNALDTAVKKGELPAYEELPEFIIEIPADRSHGDLATNAAMACARTFKMPPFKIANAITENIDLDKTYAESCATAGPGFINFVLAPRYYADVLKEIEKVRKSGLTFAPEAGSQRLRDVINKGVTEEDLINAVSYAFKEGWSRVKLYFMVGLPSETDEDVLGIKDLAYLVKDLFFNRPKEERIGNFKVTASASCFVPKPFTPFQWFGQDTLEEFNRKIYMVKDSIRDNKVSFNYHDADLSYLEAIFARGDRRLSKTLLKAWEMGCKYDGWSEHFKYDIWLKALEETNIDGSFYANRFRDFDEILPWDFINVGVTKKYLVSEYKRAMDAETTKDCRLACRGCGIDNCAMWGVFN